MPGMSLAADTEWGMSDQTMEKNSEGTIFIGAGVEFKGDMTVPG